GRAAQRPRARTRRAKSAKAASRASKLPRAHQPGRTCAPRAATRGIVDDTHRPAQTGRIAPDILPGRRHKSKLRIASRRTFACSRQTGTSEAVRPRPDPVFARAREETRPNAKKNPIAAQWYA